MSVDDRKKSGQRYRPKYQANRSSKFHLQICRSVDNSPEKRGKYKDGRNMAGRKVEQRAFEKCQSGRMSLQCERSHCRIDIVCVAGAIWGTMPA
ncbi:hypothetical protein AAMO2058_001503800 [Amorphochlora amoebiformis]